MTEELDPAAASSRPRSTFFAVSTDETRYNLNGFFFEPSAEALRLVA